jgi:cytochrome c oxidase subunit 2
VPAGRRRRIRITGLAVLALLLSGCKDNAFTRFGWPEPITSQGQRLLGLWRGSLIAAACVGAFVIGLILWSAIFYRARSDELPRQVRYNLPIEVLYTLVPLLMVSVLFYFTALRENDEDKFIGGKPGVTVEVVGFQWNWQFNYLDNGVSVTGRPGRYPTLVLPVNTTVRFYETSPDVIHAFWVPAFLFKRDVVPGRTNSFEVHLTHTGTFAGKCTEYCGVDHDRMLFTLRVVSPAQYQQWLTSTQATAQTGKDPMFTVYRGPNSINFGRTGNTQRSHS